MVVSGHPLATLAAWRTLDGGGSVVDAAISGAAVLAVVLPQACTIGGDAFMLMHDARTEKTFGLNASGPAPVSTDPQRFADGIPAKGPLSMSVPGVVGGWRAAHDHFGRLDWSGLFESAIKLADEGFPMSRDLAQALRMMMDQLAKDPGCRALFIDNGLEARAGGRLKQPALAQSLADIAEGGADAFYNGSIGDSIGGAVQAVGGFLESDDFKGYLPEWVEPIETDYRGHLVRVMPPNSYGLYMLMQLNALSGLAMDGLETGSAERFARLMKATRVAFAEGNRFVADANSDPASVNEALGQAMTARLRAVTETASPPMPNRGGTAVISVAVPQGNGITLVQSVFTLFGSAVADARTGVVLNDRMIGFTTEAGHPNAVAPGQRPAHTLNPVMVLEGGRLKYLLGTPGGPGQTVTLTQVLSNLVDLGMDISQAVHTSRWSQGQEGEPIIEDSVPEEIVEALAKGGIEVARTAGRSPFFGSAEAIEIQADGTLCGAADHRREAFVLGS